MNVRKLATALVLAAVLLSAASPALAFPATAFQDWASISIDQPWAKGYVALAAGLDIMRGIDLADMLIYPKDGRPPVRYGDLYEKAKSDPSVAPNLVPPVYEGTDGLLAKRVFGYAPNMPFTRAQAAAAVTRVAFGVFGGTVPLRTGVSPFADVDDTAWYAPYVHTLQNEGIIDMAQHRQGEAYRFEPERPITRGELAAWIGAVLKRLGVDPADLENVQPMRWADWQKAYKVLGDWEKIEWYVVEVPKPGSSPPEFADLPASYPGYENIRYAAQMGVIAGYDQDGKRVFRPDLPVSRLEAAKMLVVLANELTDGAPTLDELLAVEAQFAEIAARVNESIRPNMTYRDVYEAIKESGLARYVTQDVLFGDGGFAGGAWSGRNLPRSGARHRVIAAKPIFLGSRFAAIEVVDSVTHKLMPGTSYYGGVLYFVRDQEGWKMSDGFKPGAKPTWWTRTHCDEFGRCRE